MAGLPRSPWPNPWDTSCPSFDQRFPDCDGPQLQKIWKELYLLPDGVNLTLPWFNKKGEKMFIRGEDNDRYSADSTERFAHNILLDGLLEDIGSTPFAIPSTNDYVEDVKRLLGAASRAEGFYRACELDPTNRHVMFCLERGMTGVNLVDRRCPPDGRCYIKELANLKNKDSQGKHFMELYNVVPDIERAWREHRKQKRQAEKTVEEAGGDDVNDIMDEESHSKSAKASNRDQKGLETEYMDFIKAHFRDTFHKMDEYRAGRSFLHKAESRDMASGDSLMAEYRRYCQKHCAYMTVGIDNKIIMHANAAIVNLFGAELDYDDVTFTLLKLAIPTNDGVPWIVRDLKHLKLLNNFKQDMSGSAVFKPSMAPKAKAKPKQAKGSASAAESQAKGAPKKAAKKRQAPKKHPQPVKKDERIELFDATEKTIFAKDILNGMNFVLESVADDCINEESCSRYLVDACTFAMQAGITIKVKEASGQEKEMTFKLWKHLRPFLKKRLAEDHATCLRQDDPDAKEKLPEGTNQTAFEGLSDGTATSFKRALKCIEEDPKIVKTLTTFAMDHSPSLPATAMRRTHPALLNGIQKLWKQVMEATTETTTMDYIFSIVLNNVWSSIPPRFITFAVNIFDIAETVDLGSLGSLHPDLAQVQKIWNTSQDVENFVSMRCLYVKLLLEEAMSVTASTGDTPAMNANQLEYVKKTLDTFECAMVEASVLDCTKFKGNMEADINAWKANWTKLLKSMHQLHSSRVITKTESEWKRIEFKMKLAAKQRKFDSLQKQLGDDGLENLPEEMRSQHAALVDAWVSCQMEKEKRDHATHVELWHKKLSDPMHGVCVRPEGAEAIDDALSASSATAAADGGSSFAPLLDASCTYYGIHRASTPEWKASKFCATATLAMIKNMHADVGLDTLFLKTSMMAGTVTKLYTNGKNMELRLHLPGRLRFALGPFAASFKLFYEAGHDDSTGMKIYAGPSATMVEQGSQSATPGWMVRVLKADKDGKYPEPTLVAEDEPIGEVMTDACKIFQKSLVLHPNFKASAHANPRELHELTRLPFECELAAKPPKIAPEDRDAKKRKLLAKHIMS